MQKLLEKPSKHRIARMQITNATGNFRGTYFSQQASTGESTSNVFATQRQPNGYYPRDMHFAGQHIRKSKPNQMAITRGTGLLAKGVACDVLAQGQGTPRCGTRPWQDMRLALALAWHAAGFGWAALALAWNVAGFGWAALALALAVAWHAAGLGLGLGMACCCLGRGMACCWPWPWHGMLLALAGLPWPWHGMLLA